GSGVIAHSHRAPDSWRTAVVPSHSRTPASTPVRGPAGAAVLPLVVAGAAGVGVRHRTSSVGRGTRRARPFLRPLARNPDRPPSPRPAPRNAPPLAARGGRREGGSLGRGLPPGGRPFRLPFPGPPPPRSPPPGGPPPPPRPRHHCRFSRRDFAMSASADRNLL